MVNIPEKYRILDHCIDLKIPNYSKHNLVDFKTLSPKVINSEDWFNHFIERIKKNLGKNYLPICRMSDGEFRFLLGEQLPSSRLPKHQWTFFYIKYLYRKYLKKKGFSGISGKADISVGDYSLHEWEKAVYQYKKNLAAISESGILAMHLSYCDRPFQEHFFPALKSFFKEEKIKVTLSNYVPFYFVYALFSSDFKEQIFKGNRVLVIHGSDGEKKQKIIASLMESGAQKVLWHQISRNRSLMDSLDTSPYQGKVDLCLVGAGVGKPNVLVQLESLSVPCIDIGFIFEIWANPELKWKRTFCVSDEGFDADKVQFIPQKLLQPLTRS